jgi:hypothetical protein
MFKGQAALAAIFLTISAPIMVRPWEVLTAGQMRPDKRYSSLRSESFSPFYLHSTRTNSDVNISQRQVQLIAWGACA